MEYVEGRVLLGLVVRVPGPPEICYVNYIIMKYISNSPKETKKIAAKILKQARKKERKGALVLALRGDLGAGKTNFVQGIGEYLKISRNITSPTFVIMKLYSLGVRPSCATVAEPEGLTLQEPFSTLYHFDCYRILVSKEILDLEWKDIISKKENLILIEWAENIKDILPKNSVWVIIKDKTENKREIIVRGLDPSW